MEGARRSGKQYVRSVLRRDKEKVDQLSVCSAVNLQRLVQHKVIS